MTTVSKEQFENEAVFSLLKDSANILMRETLSPRQLILVEPDLGGWADRFVWDYLPIASKAVSLDICTIEPSKEGGSLSRVILPHQPVHDTIREFLPHFLQSSIELGGVHSDALVTVEGRVMDGVASKVADMWEWIEF